MSYTNRPLQNQTGSTQTIRAGAELINDNFEALGDSGKAALRNVATNAQAIAGTAGVLPDAAGVKAHVDSRVTQSNTDTTAGRLLRVGDFGVGGPVTFATGELETNFNTVFATGRSGNAPAIVLLCRTGIGGRKISGRIHCGRTIVSSVTSQYVMDVSVSLNNTGSIRTCVVNVIGSTSLSFRPVFLTYNGETWLGLDTSSSLAHQYPNTYAFDGFVVNNELAVVDRSECTDITNYNGLDAFKTNGNEIYHTGNILGTVSQSGGVPTGAIIQRGSNANGEWVRFADGTQICWHRLAEVDTGSVGPDATYISPSYSTPVSFSHLSEVACTSYNGFAAAGSSTTFVPLTDTSQAVGALWRFGFRNNSPLTVTRIVGLKMTAIGRWY